MTLRMELWVEGVTDARTKRRQDEEADEERPLAEGGALVPLVRKILGSAEGMNRAALDEALPEEEMVAHRLQNRFRDMVKLDDGERRRKLSTKGWKVLAAIRKARRENPDTLIVAVWDRDRDDAPLRDRDQIHDALRTHGQTGAAVGVCVEEIEAWLLADPGAFRRVFGRGPKGGLSSSPEDEPNPKAKLNDVLDSYPEFEDRVLTYRKLAEEIDIEALARSCPRGFDKLRTALCEFIIEPHIRAPRR